MVFKDKSLNGWDGLGLAVQIYQKRAWPLIEWLNELSRLNQKKIGIRLVKGAYWDQEIKRTQRMGLPDYPVYTQKITTDICYIACAKKLLCNLDTIYPQFGTHNLFTIASITEFSNEVNKFEFQYLFGMGENIYNIVKNNMSNVRIRVYGPVGEFHDLLPYLIRRLRENGASTSFLKQLRNTNFHDKKNQLDSFNVYNKKDPISSSLLNFPSELFENRRNSQGMDLSHKPTINIVNKIFERFTIGSWKSGPIVEGILFESADLTKSTLPRYSEATLGKVYESTTFHINKSLTVATESFPN